MDDRFLLIMILIALWTLPWKGWALWLAARRTEKWWFLALLIVNTFAVLEIIYIFLVAKRQDPLTDAHNATDREGVADTGQE